MMSAVDRALLDRLAIHYGEYDRLLALWLDALDACDHPQQDYEVGTKSARHSACIDCYRAAQPLEFAARAEYDAARKRQLAKEPRCTIDGCNRRGVVTSFGTLLCRAHFKRAERAHHKSTAGAGILALLYPVNYKPEDIRRMAKGGS